MVKVCKVCGYEWDNNASECISCGASWESEGLPSAPGLRLVQVLDGTPIDIPIDGAVIGRHTDIGGGVFNNPRVSEIHCKISYRENEYTIEDIGSTGAGSTNGTYLDGVRLAPRISAIIRDKAKVGIANLLFDAQIDRHEDTPAVDTTAIDPGTTSWVIVCPRCGAVYKVEDEDSRINECTKCEDKIDRKAIARVRPQRLTREQ